MYRGYATRCPACEAPLTALQTTLPMEGCEGCGGVWLGPDAAVHVLRGHGDELEREIARASASVETRASAARPTDPGHRACPRCAQTMGRLEVGATVVDTCPAHGTWFDRREVGEIVVACGALRKTQLRYKAEQAPIEEEAYRAVEREGRSPQDYDARPSAHGHEWNVFGTILEAVVALMLQGK